MGNILDRLVLGALAIAGFALLVIVFGGMLAAGVY